MYPTDNAVQHDEPPASQLHPGGGNHAHHEQLAHDFESCSWDQLQQKYADAMNQHTRAEEELQLQVTQLLQVTLKIR